MTNNCLKLQILQNLLKLFLVSFEVQGFLANLYLHL